MSKSATFVKRLGVLMSILGAIFAAVALAQLIGGSLGKAAKASSAKIKLAEQSVQHNGTHDINVQIALSKQQDEASHAVSNITYFSDPRTELCFAYLNVYDTYGSSRSITTVNCGLVPKDLLITVRK